MKKLLFILVLFFSTSVFAENWSNQLPEKFGLSFFQDQGFEVVDVTINNNPNLIRTYFVYTLTHPNGGLRICTVEFTEYGSHPDNTACYMEDIYD